MRNAATTGKRVGYGWLYNWHAVDDARGLAPDGWDIPTDAQWTELTDYLIAEYGHITSSNVGGALKSTRMEWSSPNSEATNEFGFEALPGGNRNTNGSFINIGTLGLWWSSTEYSSTNVWNRGISHDFGFVFRGYYNKTYGFSLRCIQPRRPKYGRLYTWACAAHADIAPVGWSVPTQQDWSDLTNYMYVNYVLDEYYEEIEPYVGVGNHLKSKRQVNTPLGSPWDIDEHPRWDEHETNYGRDTVGFSGLPSGRIASNGIYSSMGTLMTIWLSTEASETNGYLGELLHASAGHGQGHTSKRFGRAIRCMRAATLAEQELDDGTSCGIVTDIDGNAYSTTKIGTQVWMTENLAVTKLNDDTPINNIEADDWTTSNIGYDDLAYNNPLDDESYSVEQDGDTGTLEDIDGNIYKWVVLGNYRWMAENLRTTKYKNGDVIPEVTDDTEWSNMETGARCAYDNDHYWVYPPKR